MKGIAAAGFVAARAAVAAFCLISTAYCLVAYIPFTYQQVIEFQVVGWTQPFAEMHPWLYLFAMLCGAWTIMGDYRPGRRVVVAGFGLAAAAAGAWLLAQPLLVNLRNEPWVLKWTFVWLLPLAWLALIDFAAAGRRLRWTSADMSEDARLFRASVLTALAVTVVYILAQPIRTRGIAIAAASAGVYAWSALLHVVFFLAVFGVLCSIRGVALLFKRPALAEFVLVTAAGGLATATVIRQFIFASISFTEPASWWLALALGAAAALTGAGWAVRLADPSVPVESGIELALRPLDVLRGAPGWIRGIGLVGWAGLTAWLAGAAAVMDWNFLFQKLVVLTMWALGFALMAGLLRRGKRPLPIRAVAVLLAPAIGVLAIRFGGMEPVGQRWLGMPPEARAAAANRYAAYDVSFRLVYDLLGERPPAPAVDMSGFFALLQNQSNIPRRVVIDPPDVHLAPEPGSFAVRKPHIFFVVIDSLRPDYLSPYNPKVSFTPGIDRFAKESTVFRHAFTHYGATGLAEPSIWTGTMMPHQQYPPGIARMNSLQKLVQAAGYNAFVGVDNILHAIDGPWPGLTELDQGRNAAMYDVCRTLDELGGRVRSRDPSDVRPMFAYTQPQNVHIAAITREGGSVPAGESYPGFYAAYASRVHRSDACFAAFVETLKSAGIYDDSIVILTADHGESMGEDGRWGHAYTLFPEVLQIPMIVHVPLWMAGYAVNPDLVAFNMDLTPSLYYLLGRRPTTNDPLFGRPLFTERLDEVKPYLRDQYVISSSYGPVYAALSGDGRSLYIADATAYVEFAYDVGATPGGQRRQLTDERRASGMKAIRAAILRLAQFARIPVTE